MLATGKTGVPITDLIDMYPLKRVTGKSGCFTGAFWEEITIFTYWMRMKKGYRMLECRQMLIDGDWDIPGDGKYFKRMVSDKIGMMGLPDRYRDGSLEQEIIRMKEKRKSRR